MLEETSGLVVDTGPLSHLAKAGCLSILRSVAGKRNVIIPDAVEDELRRGAHSEPHLNQVLDAEWIMRCSLESGPELAAFGKFASRLVAGDRNVGEAAVLAYAEVHNVCAIIDDGAGRKAAREYGIQLLPTLALLCEGIRGGLLTVQFVSDIVDYLIETEYRLPFGPGEFVRWADEHDLLGVNARIG